MSEQTCQRTSSQLLIERISAMVKTKSVSTVIPKTRRQVKGKRAFEGKKTKSGITANAIAVDHSGFLTIENSKITAVSSADIAFGYMTPPSSTCSSDMDSKDTSLSLLLELDVDVDISIDKRCFLEFAIETLQSEGDEIELSPALLKIVPDAKYSSNYM